MNYQPVELKKQSEIDDCAKKNNAEYIDLVPGQLKELFIIHHFSIIENKADAHNHPEFKKFCDRKINDYKVFFFPWLNKIIKTVTDDDFFSLKTNRNQDLITAEEQQILRKFNVAVFGLSVGSNIAFLLAQAGVSNKIILADPDTLDTSNLNRIFSGISEVGINKSIIAARKIAEGNPYAQVIPVTEGINPEKLESLLKGESIHCIVEEVDSLPVKISTRRLALKYKVPVVMITDNGFSIILHVERYDLGYDKIFEKDLSYWDEILKGEMNIQTVSQIIAQDIIGDFQKIDQKLIASTMRVYQKELVAWPQLGSTAMFGGVVAMQMIKRIALKESTEPFIKTFINLNL